MQSTGASLEWLRICSFITNTKSISYEFIFLCIKESLNIRWRWRITKVSSVLEFPSVGNEILFIETDFNWVKSRRKSEFKYIIILSFENEKVIFKGIKRFVDEKIERLIDSNDEPKSTRHRVTAWNYALRTIKVFDYYYCERRRCLLITQHNIW